MALIDLLRQVDSDIETVLSDDFEIEITRTRTVPTFSDPWITYDNLTESRKKVKLLESCVLYVDIRNSASISVSSEPARLARMYSAFVKNMITAARHFGGHVRNIIGDRVMVVFDRDNCFENAYNTAALMNTIAHHIIKKRIVGIDFKCGIGIDFGEMLIAKAGAVRHGEETEFYRSLVWLGRPANVASRLTDLAHKQFSEQRYALGVAFGSGSSKDLRWEYPDLDTFVSKLRPDYRGGISYKDPDFATFFAIPYPESWTNRAILVTQDFLDGFYEEHPDHSAFERLFFGETKITVKEYQKKIFGVDVYYTDVDNL